MSDIPLVPYLFVVDRSTMSRDAAIDKLDKIKEIENWQKILPDATVLISRLGTKDLNEIIRNTLGDQRYIIARMDSSNGWLASKSWDFINKPKSVL
ncbi:hypothetical protein [Komagataeibacter xylinus]|uniref:hypothetical protein n=1 Tax=Komagataeibacter xylinus TaxID=28448 RepID=UPI001013D317|nr:hypothetical protein [Komagataeibacter xylinus]